MSRHREKTQRIPICFTITNGNGDSTLVSIPDISTLNQTNSSINITFDSPVQTSERNRIQSGNSTNTHSESRLPVQNRMTHTFLEGMRNKFIEFYLQHDIHEAVTRFNMKFLYSQINDTIWTNLNPETTQDNPQNENQTNTQS